MPRHVFATHLVVPVTGQDHTRGPDRSPVTLVEYGDYECTACGAAFPIVTALEEEFAGRLRFVFRNFPLNGIHTHATNAALAAEAAGMQENFWRMHDLLYQNQDNLEPDELLAYADALGLDLGRFELDRGSADCRRKVRRDFLGGARSGVNGTPTFFVNGLRHDGPPDFSALAVALEETIAGEF